MDKAATHKLYNVCAGISSSPKYETRVTPGKGEYGKREQEPEQKATDQIYSDFRRRVPSTIRTDKRARKHAETEFWETRGKQKGRDDKR